MEQQHLSTGLQDLAKLRRAVREAQAQMDSMVELAEAAKARQAAGHHPRELAHPHTGDLPEHRGVRTRSNSVQEHVCGAPLLANPGKHLRERDAASAGAISAVPAGGVVC
jgi:hypothetical protein